MTHSSLDLSNWQGTLDVGQFPEVEHVVLKVSQGLSGGTNPYFDWQYANAKAHGKTVAGYLFMDTSVNPEAEAQTYINRVAGKDLCFHWLDVEANYGGLGQAAFADHVRRVMAVLRTKFGLRVGIYTAQWCWDPMTGYLDYSSVPLWQPSYTPSPVARPAHWPSALMWQFTDSYAGRTHGLDASYFLGTDAQWQFYTGQGSPTPPAPVPTQTKIAILEAIVHIAITGIFSRELDKRLMAIRAMKDDLGRKNPAAVRLAQQVMAFPPAKVDGLWGPVTHDSTVTYIRRIQTALGCPVTGTWEDPGDTEFSFLVIDPLR